MEEQIDSEMGVSVGFPLPSWTNQLVSRKLTWGDDMMERATKSSNSSGDFTQLLEMAIEIFDLPATNSDFPSFFVHVAM